MKLTVNQKRFLIVWVLFHSLALFVNLAHIDGKIQDGNSSNDNTTIYLFNGIGGQDSDFWPFTSYHSSYNETNLDNRIDYYYGGLFNSYGFPEYIFYLLLGMSIVFIPKLWN